MYHDQRRVLGTPLHAQIEKTEQAMVCPGWASSKEGKTGVLDEKCVAPVFWIVEGSYSCGMFHGMRSIAWFETHNSLEMARVAGWPGKVDFSALYKRHHATPYQCSSAPKVWMPSFSTLSILSKSHAQWLSSFSHSEMSSQWLTFHTWYKSSYYDQWLLYAAEVSVVLQ